ncbi:MAG TPA: hypothetical protein VGM78_07085 [Ilumatobacteraceae bacterium]
MNDGHDSVDAGEHRSEPDELRRGWWFIPCFVIGWAIIVYGAMQALDNPLDSHPFALAVHVVTFDLGNDLLLVPASLIVIWLIGKLIPRVARGPVKVGLVMTAMFVIYSYPLIRRWGRRPTNSSTPPLAYGPNLAIVLGVVWLGAAVWITRRVVLSRRDGVPHVGPTAD